jgi:D-alanine transaminase
VLEPSRLGEIADHLLAESNLTEGEATFYVEVTRGVAPRTHQFPSNATTPTVYMTVNRFSPADELRARGATAITIPDIRWLRCDIKSIQLLPNVLGKQAAVQRGAIDSLMIRDGMVTEGSHANFMGVVGGVIRTHPINHLILPGITRAVVLEIAAGLGIPVQEEPIAEAEIDKLDEAFLTGTTTDVMPIVRVNDRPIKTGTPGPITKRLVTEFRTYLDAACGAAHATS